MTNTATIDILRVGTQLSSQSDRTLWVVTLLFLAALVTWVLKTLIADRLRYEQALAAMVHDQQQVMAEVGKVLERSMLILVEVGKQMHQCGERQKLWEKQERSSLPPSSRSA